MLESLISKIKEHFPKRKSSCIKNVLLLVLCLLHKETVCLNKLKGCLNIYTHKDTKPSSNYKRLIRIFDDHSRTDLWIELLKYVFVLLRLKSKHLIIDGTSWKRGKKWFHYMTLSIVYRNVSIPIYWKDISKHGLSNFKERKQLLKGASKHFNLCDKILLGDREYIGKDWFKLLIDSNINFIIRLKKNIYKHSVNQSSGLSHKAIYKKIVRSSVHQKSIGKLIQIDGITYQFVAVKNPKNDPKDPVIFLLTNLTDESAKSIAEQYCIRPKIEQCFKHLKSNGFCLEQINLRTKTRCRLLMAITVFAYVLSIHEGLKKYHQVPINVYSDGSTEKAVSVFRYGIDRLMVFCKSIKVFCRYIIRQIKQAVILYRSQAAILSSS